MTHLSDANSLRGVVTDEVVLARSARLSESVSSENLKTEKTVRISPQRQRYVLISLNIEAVISLDIDIIRGKGIVDVFRYWHPHGQGYC